jgi:hypothetical protein
MEEVLREKNKRKLKASCTELKAFKLFEDSLEIARNSLLRTRWPQNVAHNQQTISKPLVPMSKDILKRFAQLEAEAQWLSFFVLGRSLIRIWKILTKVVRHESSDSEPYNRLSPLVV